MRQPPRPGLKRRTVSVRLTTLASDLHLGPQGRLRAGRGTRRIRTRRTAEGRRGGGRRLRWARRRCSPLAQPSRRPTLRDSLSNGSRHGQNSHPHRRQAPSRLAVSPRAPGSRRNTWLDTPDARSTIARHGPGVASPRRFGRPTACRAPPLLAPDGTAGSRFQRPPCMCSPDRRLSVAPNVVPSSAATLLILHALPRQPLKHSAGGHHPHRWTPHVTVIGFRPRFTHRAAALTDQ